MKMIRLAAFVALLFAAAPVAAQQVQNHAIPVGRGAGVQGFGVIAPSVAGRPLIDNGAGVDPGFGTVANSGFTPGAANTVKGTLDGVNTTDLPLPSCTAVNQAWRYVSGTGINCGTLTLQTGYDMPINLGLSSSASGGALTINLTQASGAAPTSSNPVLVPFRSLTAATGTVTWTTLASTLSITVPSGATVGTSNGVPFRGWLFVTYHSGVPQLGIATCSNTTTVYGCAAWENTLQTTTAITSGSSSAGTLYAPAAVTLDSIRIIGFCEFASGLTTAGTWASACTTLQVFGPGIKKPGEVVQIVTGTTTTTTTVSSTSNTSTALTATITPTSSVNLVEVQSYGQTHSASASATGAFMAQIYRNTGTTAIGNVSTVQVAGANPASGPVINYAFDSPQAATATQYGIYIKNSAGTDAWVFLGTALSVGTNSGVMTLREIMG